MFALVRWGVLVGGDEAGGLGGGGKYILVVWEWVSRARGGGGVVFTGVGLALRLRRRSCRGLRRPAVGAVAGALVGFARGRRRTWWVCLLWCLGVLGKVWMTCGEGEVRRSDDGGAQLYFIQSTQRCMIGIGD